MSITGSTFTNLKAGTDGGIGYTSCTSFTLTGVNWITLNTLANTGTGGLIYMTGTSFSSINLSTCKFEISQAGQKSGGFYLNNPSGSTTMTLLSTIFKDFTAESDGGIGYTSCTAFIFSGTSVTSTNTLSRVGTGGLFYMTGTSSSVTIVTSTFTNSVAGVKAGGFYLNNPTGTTLMDIKTSTFTTFRADTDGGLGYVSSTSFTLKMLTVTVTSSIANTGSGGLIY